LCIKEKPLPLMAGGKAIFASAADSINLKLKGAYYKIIAQ
jgi:hypothetical protein